MQTSTHAKKRAKSILVHTCCYSLLFAQTVPFAYAAPTGAEVTGGTGTISQSGNATTINQNSQNMSINWQSYNVGVDERVQYIQPNSSSVSLNRILSNNGSTIAGRIDANGRVILVNPNGIFFTPTSVLNVGSLIASGLDINSNDFMNSNGQYLFNGIEGTSGTVTNSGLINAAIGGNVALIGKQVKNDGIIVANLGTVSLAAGKEAVLTFDNNGVLGVRVSKEILQSELGVDPAVINSGSIQAQGGKVLLTASQSQDIFSRAVNTHGIEQATSAVVNEDGSFTLGSGADVLNSGTIDTSTTEANQNAGQIVVIGENVTSSGIIKADAQQGNGGDIELHAKDTTLLTQDSVTSARSESNGKGGTVKVLGDKVGLFDQSTVDVSGASGGGRALIGGDREGKNTAIRNANFIYLSEQSRVHADGLNTGNGGKIITFAADTARIYGNLSARGGMNGGDGGFIETSGLRGFEILNAPDMGASHGEGGLWLIDPYNLIVSSGTCSSIVCGNPPPQSFSPTSGSATLNVGVVNSALQNGNVTISTVCATNDTACTGNVQAGNITFADTADINYNGAGGRTLTVNAAGDITFQAGSTIYDSDPTNNSNRDQLSVRLSTAGSVSLNGASGLIPAASITTQGGSFTVNTTAGGAVTSFTHNGSIDTADRRENSRNGGAVSITANSINLNGNITASGGSSGTGGNITLTGPVAVGADVTLSTGGGTDGNIVFSNTVNTATAAVGNMNLTLNAHDITFGSAVGGDRRLGVREPDSHDGTFGIGPRGLGRAVRLALGGDRRADAHHGHGRRRVRRPDVQRGGQRSDRRGHAVPVRRALHVRRQPHARPQPRHRPRGDHRGGQGLDADTQAGREVPRRHGPHGRGRHPELRDGGQPELPVQPLDLPG